jgi:hypothetical protein
VVDLDAPVRRVPVRRRLKKRRRSRRRNRPPLLGVGVVVLSAGLLVLFPALAGRARMVEGRDAILLARQALLSGDADGARKAFLRAESAFLRARASVENPVINLIGYLPILGRTPDATSAMAEGGGLVAQAGGEIADSVDRLPGGISSLSPVDGVIRTDHLDRLAGPLKRAQALVEQARSAVQSSPATWLLGPVARARDQFVEQLDEAERAVHTSAALTRTLPGFLGRDGVRRYFVGAQNPAELRGTGGFIGAYGMLTASNGRVRIADFRPITDLRDVNPGRIEPPNENYASRYAPFGGAGFWRNINMTPDFPSAAEAIENLYHRSTGVRLDGTVLADPFALAALLRVTGPTNIPGVGVAVDADSVVPYVTNEAFADIADADQRKEVLGEVAEGVFDRFLSGTAEPAGAARALADAASQGHLLVHAADPAVQSGFDAAGLSGRLPSADGDFLAVVANNAAGNKMDFYAERTVRYDVRLADGGSAASVATVELANRGPAAGPPVEVIGPYDESFEAGENVTYLSTYCARSCRVREFRRDGAPEPVGSDSELGHPVFWTGVRLPSGAAQRLEYAWETARAWTGDDGRGTYRLTFHGQTTIRPTRLAISMIAPEGTRIVETSPAMRMEGNRALWEGYADDRMRFEVVFERPLLARMWRGLVRFLSTPVFSLG